MALFLPGLFLPLVERANKWINGKQINHLNQRLISTQLAKAAAAAKEHLRSTYLDEPLAVERFVEEVERTNGGPDFTRWGHFRNVEDQYRDFDVIRTSFLERVSSEFVAWRRRQP